MQRTWIYGAVALLAACGTDGGDAVGEAITRDSAGISIVENTGTAWRVGEGWTVAAEPSLQIGGQATEPAYDLGRIVGAIRLKDGTIAVANGATNEIRFFDGAGTHLRSTGRAGSGPGEYAGMTAMWRTPADSLMILDIMVRRLTVLGPDGGLGRSFSMGGVGGSLAPSENGTVSFAIPSGVLADGSMVGLGLSFQINADQKGPVRDSIPAIRYGADGAVLDTLAYFPGVEVDQMTLSIGGQSFTTPTAVPLGRNSIALATAGRFYVATNEAWEIQVWDPAARRLSSLIRVASPSRTLDPAGIAIHRQEQIALMDAQTGGTPIPPPFREQLVARINSAPYPTTIPFIANLLADDAGNLWVQEQGQPGDQVPHFAVIDPSGRLLGRINLVPRFRPTHITADAIVGIWQDADDVEHVRVYALNRGG